MGKLGKAEKKKQKLDRSDVYTFKVVAVVWKEGGVSLARPERLHLIQRGKQSYINSLLLKQNMHNAHAGHGG